MDPKDKRSVDADAEEEQETNESLNQTKCCTDCQTTKTPLWRGGPAGPKSLCNACGIKYNKKRRAQLSGIDKNERRTSKGKSDLKLKVKLMVVNQNQNKKQLQQQQQQQHQRKRSSYERGNPWWNKLREEEQAAILLMAISCGGSLYS